MRFDRDSNRAHLGHVLFWRVLWVLDHNTLALVWLSPVFGEQPFVNPFVTGP